MERAWQVGPVLVTGATGALGSAVCAALLESRVRIHATYLHDEEAVRFDTRFADRCDWYTLHRMDAADERQIAKVFGAIEKRGPLGALVHVAGGFTSAPIESTSLDAFHHQIATNLTSLFLCAREAVRAMKPRGAGRIVAVGSKLALEPGPNVTAYAAAKAGVHAVVRGLAEELRGTGVAVYGVVPSVLDTPANRTAMPDADPRGWVPPSDVARAVVALLGEDLAVATGALIPVWGR